MPEFQYIAREMSGQQVTGLLTAGSEHEVASSLATKQLFPVQIDLADAAKLQQRYKGKRVRARHLTMFYSQLADLLRAGVPLLRSLELLERQTSNAALKLVLQEIRDEVADGTPLAETMRRRPKVFPELAVSMVRAGEEGSFMEDVLKRIASFTEHNEDLKSRVAGAVAYPVFLLVAGGMIVTALLVWFVPKFAPIFKKLDEQGELPVATEILMGISGFLGEYGIVAVIGLIVGMIFLAQYVKTDAGRFSLDKVRLATWGIGPIVRSLAISRFCRILGTLLHNGVPILQSLRIGKDATGNRVLSEAIANAADNISEGKTLARPLATSGQFPEEVVEMIAVGEEANNLEQVLIDIADTMERHTYRQLELFVRLLEPAMLMVMAALVLFVVVALLLPVFKMSGAI